MGQNLNMKLRLALSLLVIGLGGLSAQAQVLGPRSQNQEEADDGHSHDLQVNDLLTFKSFDVAAPVHRVFVLVRKDGHSINRPFVVEVRPTCEKGVENWSILKVADSESLCGVDPQSIKYDPKTNSVQIDYVEPDAQFYRDQISKKIKKIKERCLSERQTLSLPLDRLCRP